MENKVTIFFGSVGGNTALVCEKLALVLREQGVECELFEIKKSKKEDVEVAMKKGALIFASPTYGHGLLEPYFERFLPTIKDVDFGGVNCAVVGLGDKKYDVDYHIASARLLSEFLTARGAKILIPPMMINETPIVALDTKVAEWGKKLAEKIIQLNGEDKN